MNTRPLSRLSIMAACSLARVRVGLRGAGGGRHRVRIHGPDGARLLGGPTSLAYAKEKQRRQRIQFALEQLGWSLADAKHAGSRYKSEHGIKWPQFVSEQIERRALAKRSAKGTHRAPSALRSAASQPTE